MRTRPRPIQPSTGSAEHLHCACRRARTSSVASPRASRPTHRTYRRRRHRSASRSHACRRAMQRPCRADSRASTTCHTRARSSKPAAIGHRWLTTADPTSMAKPLDAAVPASGGLGGGGNVWAGKCGCRDRRPRAARGLGQEAPREGQVDPCVLRASSVHRFGRCCRRYWRGAAAATASSTRRSCTPTLAAATTATTSRRWLMPAPITALAGAVTRHRHQTPSEPLRGPPPRRPPSPSPGRTCRRAWPGWGRDCWRPQQAVQPP
jgi:hypothetical protein